MIISIAWWDELGDSCHFSSRPSRRMISALVTLGARICWTSLIGQTSTFIPVTSPPASTMHYYVHPFKVNCTLLCTCMALPLSHKVTTTNLEELIIIRTQSTRFYLLRGRPIVGFESLYNRDDRSEKGCTALTIIATFGQVHQPLILSSSASISQAYRVLTYLPLLWSQTNPP